MLKPISLFDLSLGNPEIQAAARVLRSGWLSQGSEVAALEGTFARYVGTPFAVATSSCTAALHMTLTALGVGPGDEVITTPLTFMATVNAILYRGARPVFADIDPETLCLSPASVQERVTPRTKAILPVHYAGVLADMKGLGDLARDHRLSLIEDAAHALGSRVGSKRAGGLGDAGCFSFYPSKTVTTCEGGMVSTKDPDLDRKIRLLRSHGMTKSAYQRHGAYLSDYEVEVLGFNYRMHEVEAAIGRAQMRRLDSIVGRRERMASLLRSGLRGLPLRLQRIPPGVRSANHLFPVVLQTGDSTRDRVINELRQRGVQASFHYRLVYHHRYYREFLKEPPECPAAEEAEKNLVSLPCHQSLSPASVRRVIAAMKGALASLPR